MFHAHSRLPKSRLRRDGSAAGANIKPRPDFAALIFKNFLKLILEDARFCILCKDIRWATPRRHGSAESCSSRSHLCMPM